VTPVFLSLAEVLEIHRDQIERYGGHAGLRDLGLLQPALAMPAAGFGGRYIHSDLLEMAAAYLFHTLQNHPFIDGNKRTGTVTAIVFLSLNGFELEVDETQLEKLIIEVAKGKVGKNTVADFFRKNSRALE
jgi:death-on-curing protein